MITWEMVSGGDGGFFTSSNVGCLKKVKFESNHSGYGKGGNQGRSCFFFHCLFVDVFRDLFRFLCFFLEDLFSFLRFFALKTCFYTVMF